MALYTNTFAIDQTREYNVVAHSPCSRIVVQENFDSTHSPTDDLLQRGGMSGSGQIRIAKGTTAIYTKPGGYEINEVAGTIQAATGSVTVQQVEAEQV